MVFKALILDLDGVLIDSEPLHARAWNHVLPPFGLRFDIGWFEHWIGITDEELAGHLCKNYPIHRTPEEILKDKRERFNDLAKTNLNTFDGLQERLDQLKALPMAVATNSMREEALNSLFQLGISNYFQDIIGSEDVEHGKPAPDVYLRAAESLGIAPEECVAIEDSVVGIQSAHAARCFVIGINSSQMQHYAAGADHMAVSPVRALDWIIEQLEGGIAHGDNE